MALCYHAVVLGSHAVAILDVVPLANVKVSKSYFNHPAIMYHVWTIHTVFYILCVMSNPGIVTRRNVKAAVSIYKYDGVMYGEEAKCSTCQLTKPARSKHCSESHTSVTYHTTMNLYTHQK